ncbi:hypothetical protein IW262DRAFT_1334798 [Armillaria fumosa]|nr:hypothetical protein IW262DRAFT_1334798 [Armillaria fumosa]
MYIGASEVIRVPVKMNELHGDELGPPKTAEGVQVKQEPRRAPYQTGCSIAECSLGHVSRWNKWRV